MVRAKLQAADGAGSLEFTFNPTEYSVTKSAKWQTPPRNMKEKAGAKPEYLGSEPQTISMQIFFDDWETAIGDVTKQVDQLFAWCAPSRMSVSSKKHQPSALLFFWGSNSQLAEPRVPSTRVERTSSRMGTRCNRSPTRNMGTRTSGEVWRSSMKSMTRCD